MIASLTYAVAVNFIPYYRVPADMVGDSQIGIVNTGDNHTATSSGSDIEKNAHLGEGRRSGGAEVVQVEKAEQRAH